MLQEIMKKKELLKLLDEENIEYVLQKEPAEPDIREHDQREAVCLFLRDEQNEIYYLIAKDAEERCSLNALRHILGSGPLTDASEKDMKKILKQSLDSLDAAGILNDRKHLCAAVFDIRLKNAQLVIHPEKCRSVICLKSDGLVSLIRKQDHSVRWADFGQIL